MSLKTRTRGARRAWAGPLATLALLAAGLGLVPVGQAQDMPPAPVATRDAGDLGTILVDPAGRTLYRFTRDQPDASACAGACATAWPPLLVDGEPAAPAGLPGVLGAIDRPDGGRQLTYNHQPLYYYAADSQPNDTTGQGAGGVWFVVTPDAGAGPAPTGY
jgi:predicted lipoprotein with Yx(FWY)xxD motif